jgi:hypothetical protein
MGAMFQIYANHQIDAPSSEIRHQSKVNAHAHAQAIPSLCDPHHPWLPALHPDAHQERKSESLRMHDKI